MQQKKRNEPLPGNAIRARTATLSADENSAGRIAHNEVVRVPQICSERDARFLVRNGRADWQQVESSFPDRAIVDDDGNVLHDVTGCDLLEKAAIERQLQYQAQQPHQVVGGTGVVNRDVELESQTTRRGRPRKSAQ